MSRVLDVTAPRRERPILMSGPMVRAILAGTKTQTRRVVKLPHMNPLGTWEPISGSGGYADKRMTVPAPDFGQCIWHTRTGDCLACPYGGPGDRLWVRHAYHLSPVYFKSVAFGAGKYAVGTDGRLYNMQGAEPTPVAVRLSHNGRRRPIERLCHKAIYPDAPPNLDWGTPAQNAADANALRRWSGEANGASVLTEEVVQAIRSSSEPQAALAERYGVTQPTISKIKSGKRWATDAPKAPPRNLPEWKPWHSAIYCPRWASRLTLEITDVRAQRVQEISEEDAVAEGVDFRGNYWRAGNHPVKGSALFFPTARVAYQHLWDSLNSKRGHGWDTNPWCWCLTFKVLP